MRKAHAKAQGLCLSPMQGKEGDLESETKCNFPLDNYDRTCILDLDLEG